MLLLFTLILVLFSDGVREQGGITLTYTFAYKFPNL